MRFALALVFVMTSAAAVQAGPTGQSHRAALPGEKAQGSGVSLQLRLGHGPLRVSQPMQPLAPLHVNSLSAPQRRAEQREPSTVPGYNPLKRRHMAMPVMPGQDGSELAF
jgi:hypothetical protein